MKDDKSNPFSWAVSEPPLGIWQTNLGTFSMLMADTLTLFPDGTGELRQASLMLGERLSPFKWQHSESGVLRILASYDGEVADDDEWETIRYCADWFETGVGHAFPVLCELDSNDFWNLVGPIELIERFDAS